MPPLRSILIRAFRLGLLVAAVFLIRVQYERQSEARRVPLGVERVRDFFPNAAKLDAEPGANGLNAVRDDAGAILGHVAQTAPRSDKIIGYAGPTNALLVFDVSGALTGLRILDSGDTPDHLAEVVRDRAFFSQFRGLRMGQSKAEIHAVSGATLTSMAIAEGVMARLGQEPKSLRFPEEIMLEEVRAMEPLAAALRPSKRQPNAVEVLDEKGRRIALAIRTSPASDAIVGYKGPSETLVLLDERGGKIRALRLRKSYDTKTYVGYVTGDAYFMGLFDGRDIADMASMDFAKAGVEGVSGATETSWSMAEGLKRRARSYLMERKEAAPFWTKIRWRWQDAGHVLVILSAFLMGFTALRGNSLARMMHHLLLVVYAGFIAGEMLSQGLFAGWARHSVPWRSAPGLVLLGVVALLGPVFTRRQLYCHHICPHGALQQLLMRRVKWQWSPSEKMSRRLGTVPYLLLAFVFISVVSGLQVDLNQIEPFDAYLPGIAGLVTIIIAIVGLVWALFTPMAYCKFGCPTGALFKLLRFSGDAEKPGLRDALALGSVLLASLYVAL